MSANDFHHPGAKVISPTGTAENPGGLVDPHEKRVKGFTSSDELAKGRIELMDEDIGFGL